MNPSAVVKAYYAACDTYDPKEVARFMHDDCPVEEPSFLPYGRMPIIGPEMMMEKIGGVFATVFEHIGLKDTRYFELDDAVVAVSIWAIKGRYTGKEIQCKYHEYFEVKDGKISMMRPFYHAVLEMEAEMDAARAAGAHIDIDKD